MEMYYVREYTLTCRFLKIINSTLTVSLIIFKNLQLNCILRYISDSIHLKDLEISKYKRESKAGMPIQLCYFSLIVIY